MTTRAYNSESRHRKQAELKARVAVATVALHAAHGVSGTTYAQIADAAGVSLPTVYAHFPTQDALLQACTRHVASRAHGVAGRDGACGTRPSRCRRTPAGFPAAAARSLRLKWREDRVVPFLAGMLGEMRDATSALIAQVLKRHLGPGEAQRNGGWMGVRVVVRFLAPPCPRTPPVASCGAAGDPAVPAGHRRPGARPQSQTSLKEIAMKSNAAASIAEIAPDTYRVSVALPDAMPGGFSFNQYLVVDEMPLVFHTGPKKLFPLIREQIETVIPAVAAPLRRVFACRGRRVRQSPPSSWRHLPHHDRCAATLQQWCPSATSWTSSRSAWSMARC